MNHKKSFWLLVLLVASLMLPAAATGYFQVDCELNPELCEGDYDPCAEFPESEICNDDDNGDEPGGVTPGDDDDDGEPAPPWSGYSDGRINPDPAEYYTIYCHSGTDTIYVVRAVLRRRL
jgi:hypothetical protein